MTIEAAVLDCDEGRGSHRIEPGDVDRRFFDRAPEGDWTAVTAFEEERGIGKRFESARQRRCDHQPQDRHGEQPGDGIKDQRPAAAALWLIGPVRVSGVRSFGGERVRQFLDRLPVPSPDRIPLRHSHLTRGLALAALLQ